MSFLGCARGLTAAALFALLLAAPAAASERHPTLGELEHEVMCPTCHQLLELSHAPIADRIRAFIQARIDAGDTKGEIKHRLVSEFGEAVLAAPPTHGFDLLAWLLPLVGLAGSGAVIAVLARRWTRPVRGPAKPGQAESACVLDPTLARRLDDELALFDG
jgi:cytochrome c-type biogenesis protein CcmH/NrfF